MHGTILRDAYRAVNLYRSLWSLLQPHRTSKGLVYRIASETGYRASEIDSLTLSCFDLDNGYVNLSGDFTKNDRDASIPLRKNTVELLKEYFRGQMPKAKAFKMPSIYNCAKMVRKDLEAAGIEIDADRGIVGFHSLRHSFGSMLAASGVYPKVAQQLMRHSDINLTLSRYTHIFRGQEK